MTVIATIKRVRRRMRLDRKARTAFANRERLNKRATDSKKGGKKK